VAREAEGLLERARGMESPGPRLRAQVAALEKALAGARTPVAVVIESDGLTEVRPDRWLARYPADLELAGEYTARAGGYRDVRRRLTVSPDAATLTVVVRCEEAL
jgi:hypothetical protein